MRGWKFVGFVFSCLVYLPATAVDVVEWDQSVIQVELVVGVEQMVQFPGRADVGVPALLSQTDLFRHLFVKDMAYWTALRSFPAQRVQVRLHDSGEVILIDLSARVEVNPPVAQPQLNIVLPAPTPDGSNIAALEPLAGLSAPPNLPSAATPADKNYPRLIRYVAQQLHAPPRLITPLPGVRSITIAPYRVYLTRWESEPNADAAADDLPLREEVPMTVVGAWRTSQWYATAFKLEVKSAPAKVSPPAKGRAAKAQPEKPQPVTIDLQWSLPRAWSRWQVHFIAAARLVSPHSNYVIVVTDAPINDLLQAWAQLKVTP